jgi:hypothetical protein
MKFNKFAWWFVLLFAASTSFAQTYTVVKLPSTQGIQPVQINNRGHVAGSINAPVPGQSYLTTHAFYWTPKAGLLDLDPIIEPTCALSPDCTSGATGINDHDWVVGDNVWGFGGNNYLWTQADGIQKIDQARITLGVNNRGTVWGLYNTYWYSDVWAYLWTTAGNYSIVKPPAQFYYYTNFIALNDRDHLLLSTPISPLTNGATASIWTKSTGFGPPLSIGDPNDWLYPSDINNHDEIVGSGMSTDAVGLFFWSPVTGTHPIPWQNGSLGSCWGSPKLNNLSQVVGGTGTGAFIWTQVTGVEDLNKLVPASIGETLTCASDINDRGQILAYGFIPYVGPTNGYVLSPKMNVALTSSGNFLPRGASITFLASVASAQGFLPGKTEHIVFKDGAKTLGVVRLNHGLADLTLSRLSVGTMPSQLFTPAVRTMQRVSHQS